MIQGRIRRPTSTSKAPFGAMVVGIAIPISVFLFFGSDRETALAASDHAGVRELSNLSWASRSSEKPLDAIEVIDCDHRWVFSGEGLSFPCEHSGVEGVRQHLVDSTETDGVPAHALAL